MTTTPEKNKDPETILSQSIPQFLSHWKTAGLATVNADNQPLACNIMFVPDDNLNLYWISGTQSAHSLAIDHNPHVALSIYAHVDSALQNHGLQLQGTASLITDQGKYKTILDIYAKKFAMPLARPLIKQAMKTQPFYQFKPTWLRWIDNRVKFGFKLEHAF
ncbi:pyridoxamine 5'-phosphate oxidase family protein [Poriferisphaera sp. WC338]|uniref:pyridoxamine 5'-phosphate oxidase family protein n=1 Tax=Poriferisphaera sp. WC338 TaxID=3425129 RepID=UPI003D81A74C